MIGLDLIELVEIYSQLSMKYEKNSVLYLDFMKVTIALLIAFQFQFVNLEKLVFIELLNQKLVMVTVHLKKKLITDLNSM